MPLNQVADLRGNGHRIADQMVPKSGLLMEKYTWTEPSSQTAFPIARPGYPFIIAGAFVTAVFALLEISILALLSLVATFFVAYFFRDPDRVVPNASDAIVAPADGKVIAVQQEDRTPYEAGECQKISIFMSVFNVHVNRIPYRGEVKKTFYHPGKFVAAYRDKASEDNERNALVIETETGKRITVVQIAGLIARRIICQTQAGDAVRRGQRYGMICFGSRLDVYLPPEATVGVSVGEVVKAGTSVIGRMA
jgi:phosphatidylserine decarboxylase